MPAKAKQELQALVAEQKILKRIYVIRGEKVMLDRDLAEMYGRNKGFKSEYQKESKPLPERLYVPVIRKGV